MQTERRFSRALDALVARLQDDRHVTAAILFGSLSYDTVWEKSDIDLILVTSEAPGKSRRRGIALVEDEVNIHASVMTRSELRRMVEGALQSSFAHSLFATSRLLFTRDETIQELYDDVHRLGARDRRVQLFQAASGVLPCLYKAEKFCRVKHDPAYAFIWLTYTYTGLARIEVLQSDQIAGREVIGQALALAPGFFGAIYTELIDAPKTRERVDAALALIDAWLTERIELLFAPLFGYLAEADGPRAAGEITAWFTTHLGVCEAVSACEWLADKGRIVRTEAPARLTARSRIPLNELAFYYDPETIGGAP